MFSADLVKYSQKYAITLTLHPKVRKYDAETQYSMYAHEVVLYSLRKLFPQCKLLLVAELTKSFDLHFHGIFQFANPSRNANLMRRFRDALRNHPIIGFCCIKVIENDDVWQEYVYKDVANFKLDVGLNPVIVDDYNDPFQ